MEELELKPREPKVFTVQVAAIRCTNCAGKIKKALKERLKDPKLKVSVNIMQEIVCLTLMDEQLVTEALQILK